MTFKQLDDNDDDFDDDELIFSAAHLHRVVCSNFDEVFDELSSVLKVHVGWKKNMSASYNRKMNTRSDSIWVETPHIFKAFPVK